jgi:hypothetical protein
VDSESESPAWGFRPVMPAVADLLLASLCEAHLIMRVCQRWLVKAQKHTAIDADGIPPLDQFTVIPNPGMYACLLAWLLLQDLARTKVPPTRRNNPATSLLLPSVAVTRLLPVPGRSAVADWAPTAGPVRPLLQVRRRKG